MRVTFTGSDGRAEQLELLESLEVSEVSGWIEAILGVPADRQAWVVDGRQLPRSGTMANVGIKDQDLVIVSEVGAAASATPAASVAQGGAAGTARTVTDDTAGAGVPVSAPTPPALVAPGSRAASSGAARPARSSAGAVQTAPVYWEGMGIDEVLQHNTNPEHIVDILQAHEILVRELNFHNPKLATHMRGNRDTAIKEMRMYLMMNATTSTLSKLTKEAKETQMRSRLAANPMDEEANKYFGDQIREEQVQESYINMMTNYPESMTRVLMLYIEVKINGVALQAFVDTGAQTSVISARCAERCNISRLIDSRFAGKVVGVGTGNTLGRVHVVDIKIGDNFFPISLTVMDDSKGLGDTNMEFLLGLDMLKRHRATVDLVSGQLKFHGASGAASTPFLHEKDLPETKGGTKGFDPNAAPADAGESSEDQAKQ